MHAGLAAHLGPDESNSRNIDALKASESEFKIDGIAGHDSICHSLSKDMCTNVTDVVFVPREYGETRTSPGLRPGGTRTPKSDLKIGPCDHLA